MDDNKGVSVAAQEEWDNLKQQNYDLKREINRLASLEKEYEAEVDALYSKDQINRKQCETKLQILEDELKCLKQQNIDMIEQHEQMIFKKDEEIQRLIGELESSEASRKVIDYVSELEVLITKNHQLEEKNATLIEENFDLKEEVDSLKKHVLLYEDKTNNLKEECNSLLENYNSKKEELKEVKDFVESLQEDLIYTKNELDILKNKPLSTDSRGNSLFAEVDERRLQLQEQVIKMKEHYNHMKKQISVLRVQIDALRNENGTLAHNWKKEIDARANDKYHIEESYQMQINTFQELIERYKQELSERPIVSTMAFKQDELAFIEYRIESKNKKIEELLERITGYSLSTTMNRTQKNQAEKEASKWQLECLQLKNELAKSQEHSKQLELKVEEMMLCSTQAAEQAPKSVSREFSCVSEPVLRSSLKKNSTNANVSLHSGELPYANAIDYSRLVKRSIGLPQSKQGKENVKAVQFSKETVEPEPKDKSEFRTKVKRIILEPVVLKKKEW